MMSRFYQRFCQLVLSLLFLYSASAIAGPVLLDQGRVDLTRNMTALLDQGGQLTIADIMQKQADFVALSALPDQYRKDAVVWLKIAVRPSSKAAQAAQAAQEWWLEAQQPAAAEQLVFIHDGDQRLYVVSGDAHSILEPPRETEYRNSLFKLALQDDRPVTLYLRLETGLAPLKKLIIWQPDSYAKAVAQEELLWGGYIGICLVLVLSSLWFERAIRDGVYLWFALYIFSVAFMMIPQTALMHHYFGAQHIELLNYVRFFSMGLGTVACLEFFFRFVNLHSINPRLARWYLLSLRTFTIVVALAGAGGYLLQACAVLGTVTAFVIAPSAILILLHHVWRGSNDIRIPFFVTAFLFTVSIMLQFFAAHGYIPNINVIDYSSVVSSAVFFLTIYYAISKRYQRMRETSEAMQSEMFKMIETSERELERQVGARTQELLTAMEEVEKELEQERAAQEEQRKFFALVSHELRTPLAVIGAAAENLEREQQHASDKTAMRLDKIKRATERLSSLFGHYLEQQRPHQLQPKLHLATTQLQPLFIDAVQLSKPMGDQHQFLINISSGAEAVSGDADLLRLVLGTLVNNAVKYTAPGTHISLHAEATAQGWHIDVSDTGSGIEETERNLIFDRYYRGSTSGNTTGTGLGLSLARHQVERHGGTLSLLAGKGSGATFRIFLPRPAA